MVPVAHVVSARNHDLVIIYFRCKSVSHESAKYIRPYNAFIAVLYFYRVSHHARS